MGRKQPDGTLSAAAPGISSTGGKGEAASLGMMVAKSGRTTGLTCAAVSAIDVDVAVDYFTDCAETAHAMTKTFTNQIAIAGTISAMPAIRALWSSIPPMPSRLGSFSLAEQMPME